LNELTDLTHKNLKHAEQLPHKLQDKIAEFNAQLDNARQDDREELEKELAELRTSETDRLQAVSEKVHKAVGELTRLESSLQQQLGNRNDRVDVSSASSAVLGTLSEAHTKLASDLLSTQAKVLAEIEQRLTERTALAVTAIETALSQAITALPAAANSNAAPAEPNGEAVNLSEIATPPKRPRKARRDDLSTAEPSTPPSPQTAETISAGDVPVQAPDTNAASGTATPSPSESVDAATHSPPPFFEPVPVPVEAIAQIQPVAPDSAQPFAIPAEPAEGSSGDSHSTLAPADAAEKAEVAVAASETSTSADRPMRKRTARPAAVTSSEIQFELTDENPADSEGSPLTSAEMVEQMISSDGATRLIATSYIGIGNRLFIRGEGPGLSWDKGVPLQFISIGKWRWETPDAAGPIRFKLYKNDDIECPGLGALVIEPGHQQEVTAKF
jgi:hypothetical protein